MLNLSSISSPMASFKNLIFSFKHFPGISSVSLSEPITHIPLISFILLSLFLLSSSLSNQSPLILASTFANHVYSAANLLYPFSSISPSNTCLVSHFHSNCSLSSVTGVEKRIRVDSARHLASCDFFNGEWVLDESDTVYPPESCPFVDDSFNCFKNRPDSDYLRYRWKPFGCRIPRFDGKKMLRMLRGKRVVFVGDSLNRNMWESLVCALRGSLKDKGRVFEVSGRRELRIPGFHSIKFWDYKCSIDFIKSPFLVEEWNVSDKFGSRKETLRLDMIQGSTSKSIDADIVIFNSAQWWTHQKTYRSKNYFQEGSNVYKKLEVMEAYTKALKTWAKWVDSNIDNDRTRVFFLGYSASHFRKGKWNTGGRCDRERRPISNETALAPYPRMMAILESVIAEMRTPVTYLNITKMTGYRRDGHPSIFRPPEIKRRPGMIQDCSHWCLPGVPDTWNDILYATLLISSHDSLKN